MKTGDIFAGIGLVLVSQFLAPIHLAGLPSLRRLRVSKVIHRPAGEYPDSYERWRHGPWGDVLRAEPEQLIIKGTSGPKGGSCWTIGIDLEHDVIGVADWDALNNDGGLDGSSAMIGVIIFGIPGIVASLPLLVPWFVVRSLIARATGLTVHELAVWVKLRGQVPEEWRARACWPRSGTATTASPRGTSSASELRTLAVAR